MKSFFKDQSVLVAGGSTGIGKRIAQSFATAGANVFAGARHSGVPDTDTAGTITSLIGDLSRTAFIESTLSGIGALDILVICYGDTDTSPGFDTEEDDWDRLLNANLSGPARLSRAAARDMKVRQRGAILFIGSICGREVLGAPIAYNVGKAGLRALTKTMARELGPHGVRVNMISPGNILFDGGRWAAKRDKNPGEVEQMLNRAVPLRRFGAPDDIAAAALFLCSDQAAFITGADLVVDGGQTIAI